MQQELGVILEAVSFVDKMILDRTNYSKEVSAYRDHREFYNEQAISAIAFCEERGIAYHIKEGTITQ